MADYVAQWKKANTGESYKYWLEQRIAELKAERRWIPVSEQKVPVGEWVEVAIKRSSDTWRSSAVLTEDGAIEDWDGSDLGYSEEDISYWMPLQAPPQEDGE